MELIKYIILGIIQGLTEFLPVSSSGHLELGKAILNADLGENNLSFSVFVHFATVLSTIVVFRKDISRIIRQVLKFSWNDETKFVSYILISMLPVTIVGLFFKDTVEQFFSGNLVLVGCLLLVTAALLMSTYLINQNNQALSPLKAFIIGIAQTIAVLPGISRSGATISAGLLLNIDRTKIARFSFLMVIPPILGATLLDVKDLAETGLGNTPFIALLAGGIAAFITGVFACKLMIAFVKQQKLWYFAAYCTIIGIIAIIAG